MANQTFQFKIEIDGIISPAVWRRLTVPGNFSFHKFHQVIQAAFGWTDSHIHEFFVQGRQNQWVIADPASMPETEFKNSRTYRLRDYFGNVGDELIYLYDFGDHWDHVIKVENIFTALQKKAACLDGGGKCPPEDVGSIPGFEEFKKAVNEPSHPEYKSMRKWAGVSKGKIWDPEEFDLVVTDQKVKGI
ncbi:MAG TPA: plasmid pRiA4b ORF-3 family protein [Puia sp.]|nr:plasmid pRiA4b ORF-3 family protein [Puia sp.]